MMRKPETDLRVSPIPQSESVSALNSGCFILEPSRVIPYEVVPLRYQRRYFAAVTCADLWFAMNITSSHTVYAMSGCKQVIRYMHLPMTAA
jgi:hypothetical protein